MVTVDVRSAWDMPPVCVSVNAGGVMEIGGEEQTWVFCTLGGALPNESSYSHVDPEESSLPYSSLLSVLHCLDNQEFSLFIDS